MTLSHQVLDTDDALQHDVGVSVGGSVVDDAGAVNEEDALHQGDVLPHLRFSRNGRNVAHLPNDKYSSGTVLHS